MKHASCFPALHEICWKIHPLQPDVCTTLVHTSFLALTYILLFANYATSNCSRRNSHMVAVLQWRTLGSLIQICCVTEEAGAPLWSLAPDDWLSFTPFQWRPPQKSVLCSCLFARFRLHRSASCGKRQPHGVCGELAPVQPSVRDLPDLRPAHGTQEHRQDDLLEQIRRKDSIRKCLFWLVLKCFWASGVGTPALKGGVVRVCF